MATLNKIDSKIPVIVVGGAVCDKLFTVPKLPLKNFGVEAHEMKKQVGGCAFHVARLLSHLKIEIVVGIVLGNGPNGKLIEKVMKDEGIDFDLLHSNKDNGWYLALVTPNGERTSISVAGCESVWTSDMLSTVPVPEPALVYANGHELASKDAKALRDWIFELPPKITRFIDLGPRISYIDPSFMKRLLITPCILSLDQPENKYFSGSGSFTEEASDYAVKNKVDIICRLGEKGTTVCYKNGKKEHIPAYPVSVVDTIGATDSHCGGTLAGLSAGWSLAEAVDLGNKISAYSINRQGSQNAPNLEELNQFFKK